MGLYFCHHFSKINHKKPSKPEEYADAMGFEKKAGKKVKVCSRVWPLALGV
jgi:hypothetical protein